ncbi:MAG: hypothetical protein HRT47_05570 [Candidatus Caenarcaniphilales bacterium]|nr:hypothetical protein [Candidatus Caenarcaniphilales bacterium]
MLSINGKLKSTSKLNELNNYKGHYIEVSYDEYLLFRDKASIMHHADDSVSSAKSINSNLSLLDNSGNTARFRLRDESELEKLSSGFRINNNKDSIEKDERERESEKEKEREKAKRIQEGVETKNITKRVEVGDNGDFSFIVENTAKEIGSSFLVRVFAPDGEELHRDNYSLKSLFPSDSSSAIEEDESKPFLIYIEPKRYFQIEKSDDPF